MIESKLIDSSIWLEYFFNGKCKEIIEQEEMLVISALSIFEIENKLTKEKIESKKIRECMDFIKLKSIVIQVNADIAHKAVEVAIKNKLATVDALIYATALTQNAFLITGDNDFRGLPKVFIVQK